MTHEKLLKAAGLGHEISAREAWKLFGIMAEFFEATERLAGARPAVSVFGSARVKLGTLYYRLAEETARLLSQAGFAVFSGGGPGLMEATNKGAYEVGGMAVGLNIDLPREQPAGSGSITEPALQALLRAQGDVREIRERLPRPAGRL